MTEIELDPFPIFVKSGTGLRCEVMFRFLPKTYAESKRLLLEEEKQVFPEANVPSRPSGPGAAFQREHIVMPGDSLIWGLREGVGSRLKRRRSVKSEYEHYQFIMRNSAVRNNVCYTVEFMVYYPERRGRMRYSPIFFAPQVLEDSTYQRIPVKDPEDTDFKAFFSYAKQMKPGDDVLGTIRNMKEPY